MKIKNLILLLSLYFVSSCALAFNKKTVDVKINSTPAGADVVIDGRNYGRTPITINIEPKNYTAVITREGYGSAQIKLEAWQAIRRKDGEGGRCLADAVGTMLIIPAFSFMSVYCRDFKEEEYSVTIPYVGGGFSVQPQGFMGQQRNPYYQQPYYNQYNAAPTGY